MNGPEILHDIYRQRVHLLNLAREPLAILASPAIQREIRLEGRSDFGAIEVTGGPQGYGLKVFGVPLYVDGAHEGPPVVVAK